MIFKDWMEHALYDKNSGYYSRRLSSLPDYVTAPNFGPYLGQGLARELMREWPDLLNDWRGPLTLVEAGCGSEAQLSRAIIETLRVEDPVLYERLQVILVDRSVARLSAAFERLSRLFPGKVFACPDINQIAKMHGAVVSNELIDAFPVWLIRRRQAERVEEGHVSGDPERLSWRNCEDPVRVSFGLDLPNNVPYALNMDALRYLESAWNVMEGGFLITIDFGDCRPDVFQRVPVKAFADKRVKYPDFGRPGSEDLTSPVDFSLLLEWGHRLGFESTSYETLGSFLIRNGIGAGVKAGMDRGAVEDNLKIKSLIHPYGFGEDFKVLLQSK
ncbi:MAG: SAM-dependent methyltransferase [Elusimicrobia bacterium]|nr:SAM-dependent methyltransferase [Elusimicrobiota bacterium]